LSVVTVGRLLTVTDQMMQNAQQFMMYVYISNQFSIIFSWKTSVPPLIGMSDVLHTPAVLQLTQWVGSRFICIFHFIACNCFFLFCWCIFLCITSCAVHWCDSAVLTVV